MVSQGQEVEGSSHREVVPGAENLSIDREYIGVGRRYTFHYHYNYYINISSS